MMEQAIILFAILLLCHFLADFPLQGEYVAKNKSPLSGTPEWRYILFSHGFIHGGLTLIVLLYFGVVPMIALVVSGIEVALHCWIDARKCRLNLTYLEDQALHILTKAAIALITLTEGIYV